MHECGVAALYWLDEPAGEEGSASQDVVDGNTAGLVPRMLLDLQNRGQLAAGLTSWSQDRPFLLQTYKNIGTVAEAFRMAHPSKFRSILAEYAGGAAIGHTRYATCGADDIRYAQPFERKHGRLWKWFSFAFNGQLANLSDLREGLLSKRHYHFSLNTDTEMIMHALAYRLRGDNVPSLLDVMASVSRSLDGAYNLAFLDAMGRMFVARDPQAFRPMNWAVQGRLFAAASESVALTNLGFTDVKPIEPGTMAVVEDGRLRFERFAEAPKRSYCFFEWVYFSNVASGIDGSDVYTARARLGERLAELEDEPGGDDAVVVPVPDTAKASSDAYAFKAGIRAVEGLIRNRYIGRTFIQPGVTRTDAARSKYTPLPSVLDGKRVFLIEDSIVRSTTLAALVSRLRSRGGAREVHVRVACPPVVAPCFYGVDMSTLGELFAPRFTGDDYDGRPSQQMLDRMAEALGVDSLRFVTVDDLGPCLCKDTEQLCLGCVTGRYPTPWGNRLIENARGNLSVGKAGRTYE